MKVGDGLPVPLIKNVIHDKQIKYSTNIKTFLCLEFSINVNQWSKHPPPIMLWNKPPSPGQSSIGGGTLQNSARWSGQTLLVRPSDSLTASIPRWTVSRT